MDTFDAIEQRRSVKHYDPEHEMTDAEVEKLLSHAVLSPTSFNIQNWRFVVVKDKDLRSQICEAAWNQDQVTHASLLIVLCADIKAWDKDPGRYWSVLPKEQQDMFVGMIRDFYEGKDELQRDEAMRSCGIAAQTLMVGAKAMGYDSCPMIGFDPEQVGTLINLPADHTIAMMLAIGKATKPANPRGGQLPLEEIVIEDRFK